MRSKSFIVGLLIVATTGAFVGCQGFGSHAMRNPYRFNMGVDGPGPGVIPHHHSHHSMAPLGGTPSGGGIMQVSHTAPMQHPGMTSQIEFNGPGGMEIRWDVSMPGAFDSMPLLMPGRHGFAQGAVYRLQLSHIPQAPGIELYPTLEVAPVTPRTQGFLQHSAVPVEFTNNDFDQVLSGNFITKVVYLPRPEFQNLATAGVGILVNTQLEPGIDPVAEASNRGAILAIIRMGNKDLGLIEDTFGFDGAHGMTGMSFRQNYISGITGPEYGIPMTQTTAGIPGPPMLPLAGPAPRGQMGIAFPVSPQQSHPIPPPAPSSRR